MKITDTQRGRQVVYAFVLGLAALGTVSGPAAAQPLAATPLSTPPARCADPGGSVAAPPAALLADGSIDADGTVDLAEERSFDRWVAARPASAATATGVDIPVYVHKFYATESQRVTYREVIDQLADLNAAYAGGQGGSGTRFEFVLQAYENVPVTRATVEVTSAHANRLTSSQHEGGKNTLNVYLANRLTYQGHRISGAARFPWQADQTPQYDGVWLQRGVLPGVPGGPATRAEGDALVHEVGHWLGLYHVYQGYCTKTGDRVADTGRMSKASASSSDCTSRDTCSSDGGRADPVPNFMSANPDSCLTSFTPGQASRMSNQWERYRG